MSRPLLLACGLALFAPSLAHAHDLRIELRDLQRGAERTRSTLERLKAVPALPKPPTTDDDHRRVLGAAEIELALGNRERALQMLVGRISDPRFHALPEYADTLLLASQLLESMDEAIGAMGYARTALERGGTPDQMAEAGARWFRLARRTEQLEDRVAVFELWTARGGANAAGEELASAAAYEAAYALRAAGRPREAAAILARTPSGTAYGSRAAYLAAVSLLEAGDLASSEKWFTAIMDWPYPAIAAEGPEGSRESRQRTIEREVRELAAMSAARLRYERGDLDGADEAYRRIPDGSPLLGDACYERAFLDMERKRQRGALLRLQCVRDVGAGGVRSVDARLLGASLLAHLARYTASEDLYHALGKDFARERDLFQTAMGAIDRPATFLFDAMERSAERWGKGASAGPATMFADVWNDDLDRAYRVDRELSAAADQIRALAAQAEAIRAQVEGDESFPTIELRRLHLNLLLRDVQHLQGHASDLAMSARRHASLAAAVPDPEHAADEVHRVVAQLGLQTKELEGMLVDLDREEQTRRSTASQMLRALNEELVALGGEAQKIGEAARSPTDRVAAKALGGVLARLRSAVMRTEAGVLDTYWVKKEHVSKRIRAKADEHKAEEELFQKAIKDLDEVGEE